MYYCLFFLAAFLVFVYIINCRNNNSITKKNNTINDFSFQRYAKFYGDISLKDDNFDAKINKIYDLIVNKKCTDINFIAKDTNCTYNECILKIKYLKNKRAIGDYYIDHVNGIIEKCSKEDLKLINKYKPYIYVKHLQISEIALKLPNSTVNTLKKQEERVYNELKYLIDKDLINGVILNEVDRKLIYYSVEKHKKEKDYISIVCPSCGALNDVNRGSKVRCEYCSFIIEDNSKYTKIDNG